MQELLQRWKQKCPQLYIVMALLCIPTCLQILKIPYILFGYGISCLIICKTWPERKNKLYIILLAFTEVWLTSIAWLLAHESTALLVYGSSVLFIMALDWYYVKGKSLAWYELMQAAVMSLFVISSFNSHAWGLSYTLLLLLYSIGILYILSCAVGLKFAIIIYGICSVGFEIISVFFHNYRYSNITLSDVLSLPTFFNVAGNYRFEWDDTMTVYLIMGIICLAPYLFIHSPRITKRIKYGIISFAIAFVSFLGLGYKTSIKWEKENCGTNYFDIFAMSVVEEIKILTDTPKLEEQKEKVIAYTADTWGQNQVRPNIVTIMCESYSDIVKIRGLETSENPVDPLWQLGEIDNHAQTGTVHVNTIGGGTSTSEWEYQTGLNHSLLSVSRVPFFNDCKKNYTFSADTLYSDYYKLYMHPYKSSGWNRTNVYKAFQYNEMVFSEEDDPNYELEDRVRGIVSDKAFFKTIEKRMEESKQPLFSMNVTMQNHGGYEDGVGGENRLKEKTVTVFGEIPDKEYTENFLTLEKLSTEAILDFVEYLKNHQEEPTLLIFFGDHYPSGIDMPEDHKSYGTPYLVYSNFCELGEMPAEMDLSLLYANAMKSARLPLSSWIKYLLSLDGETADRSMIIARIKNGYF